MRRTILIALLFALPAEAAKYALRGTVVTPEDVIVNGIVVVDGNTIADVVTTPPAGMTVIDTGGLIFPGLITCTITSLGTPSRAGGRSARSPRGTTGWPIPTTSPR